MCASNTEEDNKKTKDRGGGGHKALIATNEFSFFLLSVCAAAAVCWPGCHSLALMLRIIALSKNIPSLSSFTLVIIAVSYNFSVNYVVFGNEMGIILE